MRAKALVLAATVILLAHEPIESAQPPFPYMSVMILESVSALSPRTWDITSNTGPGVWYAVAPGQFESATSGRVTVTSARWLEQAVLCG
jgi:hypothetical protein